MKIISDNFILETKLNLSYFNDIKNYINNNEKRILDFFRLKKLTKKVTIVIDDFYDFKKYIVGKYGEYKEYIRGDTDYKTHTIRVLNLDDQIKYTTHKDANLEDFLKMVLHEFIHICNDEINCDYNQIIWFNEGLATNLANQNYNLLDLSNCDFELLKNNWYDCGKNKYSYAYTIVNYMLIKYDGNKMYKYVSNSKFLRENSDNIFNDAISWYNKNRRKK